MGSRLLVVALVFLAGCSGPPSPLVPSPEAAPANHLSSLSWSTQESLGIVNLAWSVQPSAPGLCTLTLTVTGYEDDFYGGFGQQLFYIFYENVTYKDSSFGGGYSDSYVHAYHAGVDTRLFWNELMRGSGFESSARGVRDYQYIVETDGTPFRFWLFIPSVEPSAPSFSRDTLALGYACDAPFAVGDFKAGKELVALSPQTLRNGTGAKVVIVEANRGDSVSARLASPIVEFRFWSRNEPGTQGTMVLERPNGRDEWQFELSPPPTDYRATDGPGDYTFHLDRVDVLGGGAGVLGGFRPVQSFDDVLIL